MAVCMLSYIDGQKIVTDVALTSMVVDYTKFGRWERSNEPSTGTHTVLSVLSPMALKDDWPAAQASFNPETHPAVSNL